MEAVAQQLADEAASDLPFASIYAQLQPRETPPATTRSRSLSQDAAVCIVRQPPQQQQGIAGMASGLSAMPALLDTNLLYDYNLRLRPSSTCIPVRWPLVRRHSRTITTGMHATL
jgi:hypothetical protein